MFILKQKNKAFLALAACISIIISIIAYPMFAKATPPVVAASTAFSALDMVSTITFSENNANFANPERGWYRPYSTDDIWGLDTLKAQGISVILLEVDLKAFLTGPISDAKLTEIKNAFAQARKYGLQVMFRAAYDYTGLANCEPKSLDIITGHISQLKSIFTLNEDILYCVQAGFLGPWGEWHSSYYGASPSLVARKTVLFALMNAVPKSRAIQIRRPMFIRDIFANEPGGNVLTEQTAFSGSRLSRTGFHNDALLSTADEYGTYVDPLYNRQAELNWVDNHNKYVPFGGETDFLGSNSDPKNAIFELNKLHAQVVNIDYIPSVINKWKSTTFNGVNTFDYISNTLGYRFILKDAQINADVSKGGALRLVMNIKNEGFGNLINERDVQIILSNGTKSYVASVNEDPRKWYRENGVMTKDLYFSIPSNIANGNWSLYLNLPSASQSLSGNHEYSIRLANTGVWDAAKGYNLIKSGISIDATTTGNEVTTFEQITREDAAQLINEVYVPVATEAPTAVPTAIPTAAPTAVPTAAPKAVPTAVPTVVPTAVAPKAAPTAVPTAAPTTVPTAVPTAAPSTTQITSKYSNDASKIYLKVMGTDLNKKSQFYINADNDNTTGFDAIWSASGFEYLVENGILYKYSGTNNSWGWTKVCGISLRRSSTEVYVSFKLTTIDAQLGDVIQIGFISNDDRKIVSPSIGAVLPKLII